MSHEAPNTVERSVRRRRPCLLPAWLVVVTFVAHSTGPAQPPRDPPRDSPIKLLPIELLKGAALFEGPAVGFEAETSRCRDAFEALLSDGTAGPFLELTTASRPAARIYGIEGLRALLSGDGPAGIFAGDNVLLRETAIDLFTACLDDERPVELFLGCEKRSSFVGVEAFKALADVVPPTRLDGMTAELFRTAVRSDERSSLPSSLKFRLALQRARERPGMAYLGYLFHQMRDTESSAALLDPMPPATGRLRQTRTRVIREALVNDLPEVRVAGLGAAAEFGADVFLHTIVERAGDGDEVAVMALAVLGGVAALELSRSGTDGGVAGPAVRAALDQSRRLLCGSAGLRDAAASLVVALATALTKMSAATATTNHPQDAGGGAHRGSVEAELLELLAIALGSTTAREVPLARLLARLDRGGVRSLEILEKDFAALDPRAFTALSTAAGRAAGTRRRLVTRLTALLIDEGAHWKMRLYSARALGDLREEAALPLLEDLARNPFRRLALEASRACEKLRGANSK